jgi:hypothetical protein
VVVYPVRARQSQLSRRSATTGSGEALAVISPLTVRACMFLSSSAAAAAATESFLKIRARALQDTESQAQISEADITS